MNRLASLALVAALTLAACDEAPQDAAPANTVAANAAAPDAAPSPKPLAALPDAYLGRWSTVPADCKGGAGLMKITATGLVFADVTAKVADIVQIRPTAVTATLAYTNRMGKWSSPTTLELQENGTIISKTDTHPSSLSHYTRCAA